MSRYIAIDWDPMDEGVLRRNWDPFCERRGLVLSPGNGAFYTGTGDGRVEATYETKRHISFRTGAPEGDPLAAGLALELWAQFGGSLSASPEITALIRYRVANPDRETVPVRVSDQMLADAVAAYVTQRSDQAAMAVALASAGLYSPEMLEVGLAAERGTDCAAQHAQCRVEAALKAVIAQATGGTRLPGLSGNEPPP